MIKKIKCALFPETKITKLFWKIYLEKNDYADLVCAKLQK